MEIYSATVIAVQQKVLSIGRLMSPEDTSAAMQTRSALEKEVIKGWHICGEMHPEMWKRAHARQQKLLTRLQLLKPSDGNGCAYAFIYQEIEDWQHRFIIPLAGPTVQRFVDSLDGDTISISMATQDNETAIVRSVYINDEAREDLQKSCQKDWTDPVGQVQDASLLSLRLMLPDFVAPIAAPAVNWACVTLVVPDEIRDLSKRMEQRYMC